MIKRLFAGSLFLCLLWVWGCSEENPIGTTSDVSLAPPDGKTVWQVPGDFTTIQEAIDSPQVVDGDQIMVQGPGYFSGALVDRSVKIQGIGNPVINNGPMHPAGLSQGFRMLAGSDGTTISRVGFEVDLAIMNGDAVNDVTVEHCTFISAIQAVSNWRGSGWTISHNTITDLRTRSGGGIGILVADYSGGTVQNNVVSHNKVSGTLYVHPQDCGGYNGSGVVLYADFRWGRLGAVEISNNQVVYNTVALSSDTPQVVDVVAVELTDTRDDPDLDPVIFGNAVGFNDLRGTVLQTALTPENLDEVNDISRNLGENRGHGIHPSVFNP